jgi:AcrR family transcriptional regulator
MSDPALALSEARPYHHGDLRRALLAAARKIMEEQGAIALSLRAVAREAGVSPAAPYHHFRDKAELLAAVAHEGFQLLGEAMRKARDAEPDDALTAMGVAYVLFSQEHAALYRVMTDCSRVKNSLPEMHDGPNPNGPYYLARAALIESGAGSADDELGLEITTAALWCAVHGLAEMADSDAFKPLIEALGGPVPFYRAALSHIGHLKGG